MTSGRQLLEGTLAPGLLEIAVVAYRWTVNIRIYEGDGSPELRLVGVVFAQKQEETEKEKRPEIGVARLKDGYAAVLLPGQRKERAHCRTGRVSGEVRRPQLQPARESSAVLVCVAVTTIRSPRFGNTFVW